MANENDAENDGTDDLTKITIVDNCDKKKVTCNAVLVSKEEEEIAQKRNEQVDIQTQITSLPNDGVQSEQTKKNDNLSKSVAEDQIPTSSINKQKSNSTPKQSKCGDSPLNADKILELKKKSADIQEKIESRRKLLSTLQNGISNTIKVQNCASSRESNSATATKSMERCSKRELRHLVEDLQELLGKLALEDSNVKAKAEQLALKMPTLKDFPLFSNSLFDNKPSTSRAAVHNEGNVETRKNRRRHQHGRKDSENSTATSSDCTTTPTTSNVPNRQEKIGKVKETKKPHETFLQYINNIIADHLGEQEQEQIEKLKCNISHLEDLDAYAQTLVQAGLGRIVEEEICVNKKNNRQAFIRLTTDRESTIKDGMILSPVARKYAFSGDVVRAFVLNVKTELDSVEEDKPAKCRKPRKESTHIKGGQENSICLDDDEDLFEESSPGESDADEATADILDVTLPVLSDNCPKAFVIKIITQTELREIVGSISFVKTISYNNSEYYKLKPHDMRVPMVYIPVDSCKEHVQTVSKDDIVGMLYLAHILDTDSSGVCIGELLQPVGKVGNLEAEIKAILLHNGFKDLQPYDQKFYDMYDGPAAPITDEDLKNREDLREKCVFTIDPLTARDLDDAMSIEKINDNEYEIGVHISDVCHYLKENSELDNLVKLRATSIYLVTEVIHMLPQSLCLRCSLLPGEDKYAFSVFWRMNLEGKQLSEPRFTRTIINSCSQFAYEHAQKIIDNPNEEFGAEDFPEIVNNWTAADIKWRVLTLNEIAEKLKAQRYDAGAIAINNPKLRFTLDPISGEPRSYAVDGRQSANFLIEEFMLLANQSVARFIHTRFPNTSILRSHEPPLAKSMKAIQEKLSKLGLQFDISSSKTLFESMRRLCADAVDPLAMDACLNALLIKPMARAKYFCSEDKTVPELCHYALSIPIYTHFTSPIRRYPDILVHRSLAAALNYCPPPKRTTDELHELAKISNEQKFNAKNAGEESSNLFFKRYIQFKKSLVLKAVVTEIYKNMINVITIETGHTMSINYKMQKVLVDTSHVPDHIFILEKNSKLPPTKLQLFSTVDIILAIGHENRIVASFISPDRKQRRLNSKDDNAAKENNSEENAEKKRKRRERDRKDKKNHNERFYALKNE